MIPPSHVAVTGRHRESGKTSICNEIKGGNELGPGEGSKGGLYWARWSAERNQIGTCLRPAIDAAAAAALPVRR